MQILNFTGKRIAVSGEIYGAFMSLGSDGHAKCEGVQIKQKIAIDMVAIYRTEYGRVTGLPSPDPSHQKLYIVTEDVAKAAGPRFDLLVPKEPFTYEGSTIYKLVSS